MPTTPMRDNRENDATWERDWRRTAERRLDENDDRNEKSALILERCIGILNEHDRRIKALEERPDRMQAQRLGVFGLANSTIYTLVALVALGFDSFTTVLALASSIIAVIALVHH